MDFRPSQAGWRDRSGTGWDDGRPEDRRTSPAARSRGVRHGTQCPRPGARARSPVHRGRPRPGAGSRPARGAQVRPAAAGDGRRHRPRRLPTRNHLERARPDTAGRRLTDPMAPMLPSAAHDTASWDRAGTELVENLRDLIRIPSINPPPADAPDGELRAATHIAAILADAGIPAEIEEPVDGRGSVIAMLRGDGSGGGHPLL